MGYLSALDMAAHAPLDAALSWHLTSNHFPPLPTSLIPVAKAAIEAAQDEDWDRQIDLPDGMNFRDRTDGKVSASAVIESLHLDAFLVEVDDEEEE